ncbi:MAG: hypothetical protein UHD64_00325, partial [Bacteroidales bacterium]|nr:hypothetical protein [Bacteroidales bacterium]
MAKNYGKEFEQKFKEDFLKIENSTIDRLYDVTTGYKSIKQVSDFIGYVYPNIFYIECKSHRGASIPMGNITQYDRLKEKVGIKGVRAGVVLWLVDKDIVMYVPMSTITQLKRDGEKSVGIRHLNDYNIITIPSTKK